jgi:heptosyltransferase-1
MTVSEILVIKPSSLGDVIHTLPAVAALKHSFPSSAIRWIVNSEWRVLLEDNPYLTETIPFPREHLRGIRSAAVFFRWCHSLASLRPDLVLDFQGLFRSAWMARSTRGKIIYGLSDAREGARLFYQRIARVDDNQHAVERYQSLAHLAGADSSLPVEFPLPAGKLIAGFCLPRPLIVLHPFSRGLAKSLSIEELDSLIQSLAPLQPVVVGRSSAEVPRRNHPFWLIDRTGLPELIWLLRQADFVVSVDSGPLHLAAAVSRKLLAIHFWSDPRHVGPYRPDALIWYNGQIFQFSESLCKVIPPYAGSRPSPSELADLIRGQLGNA